MRREHRRLLRGRPAAHGDAAPSGPELKRLTPRNNDKLLFDGIPWVSRAQEEHDAFAEALRSRGVEVLYLAELLVETLASERRPQPRDRGGAGSLRLGDTLRDYLRGALAELSPEELTRRAHRRACATTRCAAGFGLVTSLLPSDDFLIDPLPNLLFTRDSSVWIRDKVAITSLAMPARERESQLTELIYTDHPRFAGVPEDPRLAARARRGRRRAAARAGRARRRRRRAYDARGRRAAGPPGLRRRCRAHRAGRADRPGAGHHAPRHGVHDGRRRQDRDVPQRRRPPDRPRRHRGRGRRPAASPTREPFLVAAAKAMEIDTLHQIDTGLDPVTAEREQWDDGNNTLALAPRVAVAYERNVETNSRLEEAGIEVIAIAGSELGSGRGGPRCMSCPIARDEV